MTQERDCIVSVAEMVEVAGEEQPSFLSSPEAMAAFAEILAMSPQEAQEALNALKLQKAVV